MKDTDYDYDLFMSYSYHDAEYAQKLAAKLEERGMDVLWDRAARWCDDIAEKLLKSRYLLLLLSPNSAQSLEVQRETQFKEQYGGGAESIIILRIAQIEPEDARTGLILHFVESQPILWDETNSLGPDIVEKIVACVHDQRQSLTSRDMMAQEDMTG